MKIVVIGGGTAGITVLAQLKRRMPEAELVLIDRAEHHYYQPLWTLVGGGLAEFEETEAKAGAVLLALAMSLKAMMDDGSSVRGPRSSVIGHPSSPEQVPMPRLLE